MSVRRFSVTSVLDVGQLEGYYNRLDVYASFTDDGEYDYTGAVDGNIRPHSIFAYMINDVVGRYSRETTLYSRVFRYRDSGSSPLEVAKYRIDDYELDYQKLVKEFPDLEEELDEIYTLVPGQLTTKTGFAHLWQLTYRLAVVLSSSRSQLNKKWRDVFLILGYKSIIDKTTTGIISKNRRPCIVVLDESGVEDLEIVSTQRYKKEQNTRMISKIVRFNSRTKVSNARNRIKKW